MRWKAWLDQIVDICMAVVLLAMALVSFIQVFCRYVLNSALPWPEEVIRMMIVWLTFVGAYVAQREKKHIGINLLVQQLPPGVQKLVALIAQVLVAIFLVVLIREGTNLAVRSLNSPMAVTGVSMGKFIYSVFPISGALMLIQTVLEFIDILRLEDRGAVVRPVEGGQGQP